MYDCYGLTDEFPLPSYKEGGLLPALLVTGKGQVGLAAHWQAGPAAGLSGEGQGSREIREMGSIVNIRDITCIERSAT